MKKRVAQIFIIFYILCSSSGYAQIISKSYPAIVRTNNFLTLEGSHIEYVKYLNFPDSGIIHISERNFNGKDSVYKILIPDTFKNAIYVLYGIFNNNRSVPRLVRTHDFPPDSVGLTIWGATSNGIAVIPDSVRKIVYIASGNGVTFALKADATVFGWGYSLLNQTAIPPDLKDVVDIRGGSAHVIALKSDGRMVSWGTENNYPNINPYNGRSIGNNFVISQTPQDSGYIAITTGFYYSCALKFNFQLTCWGGDEISYFTVPLAPKKIARFSGGDGQLLLLFNDGTVKNLNDGSYSNLTPPKNFTNIIRVSAGGDFNTVLDKFGKVSAWGNNDVGQTNIPAFLDSIIDIANSSQHSSALRFNGDVFAWGSNNAGQINIPSGLNNVITINSNSSTARTLAIHYIIVSTKIDSGGSILPKTFARNNDAVRVTYKIDSNYRIDSIFINGIYNPAASKDSLSGYTFYKLIGLANIYVKLKRLYKINTLVKNGSISPSIWIDSNSNFKVTFLPNSNLVIDSVVINDDYQRFNYDSLLLSISGRNVTKNISIIIIFNPPLPPFSSGYPNAAQSFVQCDSNVNKANFTISAYAKNLKVQNKDFIKLTRFQWYRNNRNDTTNLVLMEGDSGRLFTLDTVLSVQPTRNIVDTGFYFIKVFNSYGLYAYSDPIGPIITHPLPTSKVYINNNNGLQCIALGDSNRVAYHIYNPNGEIITHQIFETNSEGNNQTKVNTIQVNDTFFTNYFRLLQPSKKYFLVKLTNNFGCSINSNLLQFQWYKFINFGDYYIKDSIYCAQENARPLSISAVGLNSTQINYFWYVNNSRNYIGAQLLALHNDSLFYPPTIRDQLFFDTTYFFSVLGDKNFSCAQDTSPFIAEIIIKYPKIIIHPDTSLISKCYNKITNDSFSIDINANFKNDVIYNWFINSSPIFQGSQFFSTSSKIGIKNFQIDTSYYFCVIQSNLICPNLFDTSLFSGGVINYPSPIIINKTLDTNFCQYSQNAQLQVNYTYRWSDALRFNWVALNELVLTPTSNSKIQLIDTRISDSQYYIYYVSNPIGCVDTSLPISVFILPAPNIIIDSMNYHTTILKGNSIKLNAYGANYFVWQPQQYFLPYETFSSQPVIFKPDTEMFFKITATNFKQNCSITDSFRIKLIDLDLDIFPSPIVTPNNDGINDVWFIKNIEYYPENIIEIYNKNGSFSKSFIDFTNYHKWHGFNQYFSNLPNGEYFYLIKLYKNNNLYKIKNGNFIIRRD